MVSPSALWDLSRLSKSAPFSTLATSCSQASREGCSNSAISDVSPSVMLNHLKLQRSADATRILLARPMAASERPFFTQGRPWAIPSTGRAAYICSRAACAESGCRNARALHIPFAEQAIAMTAEQAIAMNKGPVQDARIYLGRSVEPEYLELKLANRHGLISGATGTGKTVSLQVLAEGFSAAGVAVFAADVKGDLSGIAEQAAPKDWLLQRAKAVGLADWASAAYPTVF